MINAGLQALLVSNRGKLHKPVQHPGRHLGSASVVIPCYRYGMYLPDAVSAALDQPGLDMQVVIVDDCSPDDSGDIADSIANMDSRVSVIHHSKNLGHIATYNDGLDAVTSDFVALVSADDLLTPGALTRAADLMTELPNVGFTYGRAVHFTKEPPATRLKTRAWITWNGGDWIAARCKSGHNVIASPEVVMRTALTRSIGGYREDLPHSGDLEMWMRAAAFCDVGYIAGPDQALYREHPTNMHKQVFKSGQAAGQLLDLEHRLRAFEAVLDAPTSTLKNNDELRIRLHRRMADEALEIASHAYLRDPREFPVVEFETFARRIDPDEAASSSWRELRRRQASPDSRLPVNPRWVPTAVVRRLTNSARWWRMNQVGS